MVFDVRHPLSKKLYDIDLKHHPFAEVDQRSAVATFRATCDTEDEIYFNGDGTPYCLDPQTVLLEQLAVTLNMDKHKRVVVLSGITGRVTIQ